MLTGAAVFPADRTAANRALGMIRAGLGNAATEAAQDAGRALALEEALADALALAIELRCGTTETPRPV